MTTTLTDNQPRLRSMNSPLEFWDTVRRECDRADRYKMRLSMAVYEIGINDEKNLQVKSLVRRLATRVRNIDFIGWFDTGQIGILLPHTPNEGATKLAQDIFDLLSPLTSLPPFTIYTYPSERWPIKKSFLLRLLKLSNNFKILVNPQGITKSDELRTELGMELDRANRYGHTFCLLVFHKETVVSHGISLSKLVKVLNNRLRETDTFGWYGSGDIAVILPYSILSNAILVGKNICELVGIPAAESFTAYSYPHQRGDSTTHHDHEETPEGIQTAVESVKHGPLPAGFLSQKQFKAILENELTDALVNGHLVSLLIFDTKGITEAGGSLAALVDALARRIREQDRFGWYEDGNIGVLLPYTSHNDAITLSRALCDTAAIALYELVKVNTYPTHWFPGPAQPPKDHSKKHGERQLPNGDRRRSSGPSVVPSEFDDFIAQPIPFWKRALDLIAGSFFLFIFSPVFLLAAIGIKLSSPGPILFKQTRIGYKRKPFTLYKFRSMHAYADAETHRKFMKDLISSGSDQPNTKLETDERIFPFGTIIRRASIDELPQLFNVLKGEMSLVGPRPCMDYEADEYLQWHTRRFHFLPGITGLWQVSGKNRLSFKQMIRLDIQYGKKMSLWNDLKILVRTIPALVSIFFEEYR